MNIFGEHLTLSSTVFLLLALGLALSFEFVNGFHDTANAVATVIYTHTLKPTPAVIWSGCWNLLGVLTSSGGVAFGIVSLLPVDLVVNVGSATGFAMIFALLLSAILWNLGTWYMGLPASSSHTLIGSIMGVGLGNSWLVGGHISGEGVNWAKAGEVGTSLLVSPIAGFFGAALLLLLLKLVVRRPELYQAPEGDQPPPPWIRGVLILTCTGVSFFHGSNDGQKGMGLVMLILIGILPGTYALHTDGNPAAIVASARSAGPILGRHGAASLAGKAQEVAQNLSGKSAFSELTSEQRRVLRGNFYVLSEAIGELDRQGKLTDSREREAALGMKSQLDRTTRFIPAWVKFAVAITLGLGTMIGWKRIVVTVGEKIGKQHLTYAQGASAELVAMATMAAADGFNLPVSTTHVLSSGIAGTMAANRSGLQTDTLRNILLAWVLTLPVCVLLGATLFAAALYIVLNVVGLK